MTAIFGKIRSHFTNWREWEINPIVIKELRQGVRSWTVTGMLLLFLVVLFIASLGFLITESFDVNPDMGLGGMMFGWFMAILAGASLFFIPLYTGIRVAAERQENNPDLLYVTTLSPTRIVLGKFLCSSYITLLFFSACMPFMAFTNLLRGVDLPTVFFILFYMFLIVCAANMIAIFLACLPLSRAFKFLFIIAGILLSFTLIGTGLGLAFEIMRSGVGVMMSRRDFWVAVGTVVGMDLLVTGLFFVLSVALISPPSANRALPVRLYLTGAWLVSGVLAASWVARSGDGERMNAWMFPTFVLSLFALLVTISNSDQLSQRVRGKIPRSRAARIFAFLFFNGAAGGLVWLGGIVALTFTLGSLIADAFPRPMYPSILTEEGRDWYVTTAMYAFDYSLTAVLIHRKLLPRRPAKLTGLLAVLLAGAWAIAPSILLFFANQLSWKSVEGLQLGNVFNVYFSRDSSQLVYHRYFACGWLVLVIALNIPWFLQQVRNFRPPEAVEKPAEGGGVPAATVEMK